MRAIEQWVAQQLGPSGPWVRLDAMRGSTAVFGLTTTDGHERVVKQFRSARAYEQEHRALSRWFGAQERLGGARVPKLIAAAPELAALILERLPGTALDNDAEEAPDVHRAAGRFLAALHQLPWVDDDPLPLADALVRGCARLRSNPSRRGSSSGTARARSCSAALAGSPVTATSPRATGCGMASACRSSTSSTRARISRSST